MRKIFAVVSVLLGILVIFGQSYVYAEKKEEKKEYRGEYRSPAWMDNERIICVKYTDEVKSRLFKWFGDITDAGSIVVKQEIQFVSMDINGENEKLLKSIVIDYPGQSPKWREEVFKGVLRINSLSYCPQRKLIAFSTHGFTKGVFMVKEDGTEAKKIVELGGCPRFSPDGKYLQYTSYKVWLYDLDTGDSKVLIENAGGGPWSPDGKKIFFSRKINKDCNVFLYDFETKQETPAEALNKRNVEIIEDWSPDGTMITTSSGAVYSLQGEYLKEPSATTPANAKWSFNGKHFVGGASGEGYISVVESDGSNLRILR
ncbi:MAG: hypothetical protein V2A64_08155 [Candidatus Omnitrophota bacterium]